MAGVTQGMAVSTYRAFVTQAQDHLRRGSSAEVALLYLLLEVEPLTALWGHKHRHWEDVLRDLHLTSPTRYYKFKTASQVFTQSETGRLGVSACVLLAGVPTKYRVAVKEKACAWWAKHRIPMLPKDAKKLIHEVSPAAVIGNVAYKHTLGNWRSRAHRLEALLLKHGVAVPPLEANLDQDLGRTLDASVAFVRAQFRLKQAYPSCALDDLARIAMEQVETASLALKQTLGLPPKKARDRLAEMGPSTRVVDDEMIRNGIHRALEEHPEFLTSAMVLKQFAIKANSHRVTIRQRILDQMRVSKELRPLGKVGATVAFARNAEDGHVA